MRAIFLILIASLVSACAARPDLDDAYARAQAVCGGESLADDAASGWSEYSIQQDTRNGCLSREVNRNDADGLAVKKAFDESVSEGQ